MANSSQTSKYKESISSPKQHFIESLMQTGETRLANGDASGIELLNTAAKLEPDNLPLFHRQGLAIYDFACQGNTKALHVANQKFKKAVTLNPSFFEGWLSWGNALFLLGSASSEHHYFLDAKEKFEKALSFARGKPKELLVGLYWNYGLAMCQVALKSGEVMDLHLSYEAFHKASLMQEEHKATFWSDFGHVSMRLHEARDDMRYLIQAIEHYKRACSTSLSDGRCWTHLGDALTALFHQSHEEEHFEQANECYSASVTIECSDPSIWLKWARLLLVAGREHADSKWLHTALEKCHKARALGASVVDLDCVHIEILAELGTVKNRLKNLRKAEEMADELVEKYPKHVGVRSSYGFVLLSLAQYFNCLDYYLLAVEAFQTALSADRTLHKLWHAMGTVYVTIAPMEDEATLQLERAVRFFEKAIEINKDPVYYFSLATAQVLLAEQTDDATLVAQAIDNLEHALGTQKNAFYLYPDWLASYSKALTLAGQLNDSNDFLEKALDILDHLQTLAPDYPELHYRLGMTYAASADIMGCEELFSAATHHFRIADQHQPDDDNLLIDWATTLMHWSEHSSTQSPLLLEAKRKLTSAAKLGNATAYYCLAEVCATLQEPDRAMLYLERAHKFGALPALEEVVDDEWLEPLHNTQPFQDFIVEIQKGIGSGEKSP
ncbi:MAG: hypothetical protein KDK50_02390 [Chlamydiia bacterium]|nr:hypothetical protein [Chlamydiia bacterium]